MLLAQISDCHVALPDSQMGKVGRTVSYLESAVAHLEALKPRPDVVVVTGDLVDAGSREEYEIFADLLAPLTMPVYVIPGNHDDREAMRSSLRARGHDYLPTSGFLCYAVDLGSLRLIALDTNVPGQPGGRLCAERLSWLKERLAESDAMTLVLQHHPPFLTGLCHMDAMGLEGCSEEAAVVATAPHVERILCGHLHRPITHRFAGTVASTCPSTAHQLELDLRQPGRLAVLREPPACQLHFVTANGQLVSHTSLIGDFGPALVLAGE